MLALELHYKKTVSYLLSIVFVCLHTKAIGQQQPKIQNMGVLAPANIKIDGELKEWPNKNLFAFNSASRIYYVISNDERLLYITVRGADAAAGFKILQEGVTFSIGPTLEKSSRKSGINIISIRFPTHQDARTVSSIMYNVSNTLKLATDTLKNKVKIDSLTILTNRRVGLLLKEIRVLGISEFPDSTLSVYNDKEIKAAFGFSNGYPVVEMAVPLKYLNSTILNNQAFSYQIKLSSPPLSENFNIRDIQKTGTTDSEVSIDDAYRLTDTELRGTYTLIKK